MGSVKPFLSRSTSLKKYLFLLVCVSSVLLTYARSSYYDIGKLCAKDGDYKRAIEMTRKSMESDCLNEDKSDLLRDYIALCKYYSASANPDSCVSYADKSVSLAKENITAIGYEDVLRILSEPLAESGWKQRALDLRIEVLDLCKNKFGEKSPEVLSELRMVSIFAEKASQKRMAIDYAIEEETLSYLLKDNPHVPNTNISFSESLAHLMYYIQNYGDWKEGIYCLLVILKRHKEGMSSADRSALLDTIWNISRENDFIEGCIAVYKEEALSGDYKTQLTNIINLIVEYPDYPNDPEAFSYVGGLYDLIEKQSEEDVFDPEDLDSLYYSVAQYLREINEREKSFLVADRYFKWLKRNNRDVYYNDIYALMAASYLPDKGEYILDLCQEILDSGRHVNEPEVLEIVNEYLALGRMKIERGKTYGGEKSKEDYLGTLSAENEYQSLRSKASICLNSGRYKELLSYAQRLMEFEEVSVEERREILMEYLIGARENRRGDLLEDASDEFVSLYRNELIENIPLLTEQERMKFFKAHSMTFQLSYDYFIGISGDTLEWCAPVAVYDYTLLKKGILLTSQNQFRNALQKSKDPEIQRKYELYLQYELADSFSLEREILRRDLVRFVATQSVERNQFEYNWRDVQKALKQDEAAVEYIYLYNFNNFSELHANPQYLALLITKECEAPILLWCSDSKDINALTYTDYLDDHSLSAFDIFWRPLMKYLEGVRTIYFSATEDLNSIPIEYISSEMGRANELWNLVRVSSTRELINHNLKDSVAEENKNFSPVLFGGLSFDMDKDELIAENAALPKSERLTRGTRIGNIRYGVEDLPNTEEEVKEIAKLFKQKNIDCAVYTAHSGTEDTFKNIGTKAYNYNLLHLSTHGFYWSEKFAKKHTYVDYFSKVLGAEYTPEDQAMFLSGLIFSGANVALRGESLPSDIEDGLLTTHELSSMNLSNIDLAVLSACDTGLGQTTSEGVFGLQRGFKLAGVQSLLMSLWKVDDEATKELMIEFYRNLLSGKTKIESLKLAQQYVRNQPEFSHPKYWGAWILLDAFN